MPRFAAVWWLRLSVLAGVAAAGAGASWLFGPAAWRSSRTLAVPTQLLPLPVWSVLLLAGGALVLAAAALRRGARLRMAGHAALGLLWAAWAACLWTAWLATAWQHATGHTGQPLLASGSAPWDATVLAALHAALAAWARPNPTRVPRHSEQTPPPGWHPV